MLAVGLLLLAECSPVSTQVASRPKSSPSTPVIEPTAQSPQPDVDIPTVLSAHVTRIIDGDTASMNFRGATNEKVRFIGMDTPERGRPYFSEASHYAADQLQGKQVYLEIDVDERDRYGRLLAYVWLSPPTSGTESEIREKMFNAKALLDGYAALLTVPPNVRYVDFFVKFQKEARLANSGLWGAQVESPGLSSGSNCDPSYPDVCIPPPPPDLDCSEISHRNFRVLSPDPHGFDGNRDGYGCQ